MLNLTDNIASKLIKYIYLKCLICKDPAHKQNTVSWGMFRIK